ncbi:MAG: glycoside hydrolase family 3 protein [Sphaerochaeta sp.]|jgi:beta-N-acetylhexosaminidase|nr:glycoside hydrolase family 3 protein [Sphaerochaeta sp.]MCI2096366.1 glycoside hydrolase family 3 protein [Sphaerochaeta sp.]MCI2104834.1 glycoside hydrolase family 3 protein [Sphaerochaeta sp.]MCI2128750.1 glycoside hydrolase family 3 protein [Sphaerochaeta sp.]
MHSESIVWQTGQRLVTGFPGSEMDDPFRETVARWKIANVILFSRNLTDADGIGKLCGDIDELVMGETGTHPWIMIDQEGGMVSRLPVGCAIAPGAMALSALDDADAVYTSALQTARELRALGINVNLAPVLDVNANRKNPVIGVRSYGDDPGIVAKWGKIAAKGYQDGGVLCCGKHFPGHGNTSVDSHLSLPLVDKPKEALSGQLFPFEELIKAGIPSLMTSHVLFPAWEPERIPCTMSRNIITGLLRDQMGFTGLVFSDCMEMKAIATFYGTVQGAVKALQAGVDQVMISHHSDLAAQAAQAVVDAVEKGQFDQAEWDASLARIAKAKQNVMDQPPLPVAPDAITMMDEYARKAITLVSGTMPPLGENLLFVGPQGFITSNVQDKLEGADYARSMAHLLGGRAMVISANPSEEEQQQVVEAAAGCQVYLGTYNAHLNRGQIALALRLIKSGLPVVVTALRNPYDLEKPVRDGARCTLATWEYSERIFAALAGIYAGNSMNSHMPVALE